MNNDIPQYADIGYTGTGYLVVRATTASGALPIENAVVTVYGNQPDFSAVIARLRTGNDGLTPKIALTAPPRSLSEAPGNGAASFATYNLSLHKDGFYPLSLYEVPVFDGVTSVQPADLIPLLENGYPDSFDPYGGRINEGNATGSP